MTQTKQLPANPVRFKPQIRLKLVRLGNERSNLAVFARNKPLDVVCNEDDMPFIEKLMGWQHKDVIPQELRICEFGEIQVFMIT